MNYSSIRVIIKKVTTFFIFMTFCSCASLYTGRDLPILSPDELPHINSSITFRFISIVKINNTTLQVQRSSFRGKSAVDYITKLGIYREVKLLDLPFESLSVSEGDNLNKLLEDSIPAFKTDYFIEVRTLGPFQPHGGGLGMWGGLISTVSLGVIPAWWYFDKEFDVIIYDKKQRKRSFSLKENYHSFSSTLFHLIPSAEYSLGKSLNKVEKNALVNILKNISVKLQDE